MEVTGRRCVHGSKVSPRVIVELPFLCCLPPICMLLFQPVPALPATSRYWLFCHRLHLEILRHIHSLTSGTISVSACTLNNKARGNFFQDFFFFNFYITYFHASRCTNLSKKAHQTLSVIVTDSRVEIQSLTHVTTPFLHPLHGAGQPLPKGLPPVYPSCIPFYPHFYRKHEDRSLGIMKGMCS